MKVKKEIFIALIISLFMVFNFVGCKNNETVVEDQEQPQEQTEVQTEEQVQEQPQGQAQTTQESTEKVESNGSIILATTTSTQDSGLLDYLLPKFTEETGTQVKVVAVGTGKAIQMGVDGEADVLLVHAKASEEEFVQAGHGEARYDVMYNDFIIIGPKDDPAGLIEKAQGDVVKAFELLSAGDYTFVSRGDDSGTDKKEKAIWKQASIEPAGDWYLSTGKGMGEVIQMTNELLGYTLSDRATFLSMRDQIDLKIVVEKDSNLLNQYGVIPVNPSKNAQINGEGALTFVDWILSENTQKLIGEFGVEEYGEALFTPNAQK